MPKDRLKHKKQKELSPEAAHRKNMKDIDTCMKVLFTIVFGFAGAGYAVALLGWLGIR